MADGDQDANALQKQFNDKRKDSVAKNKRSPGPRKDERKERRRRSRDGDGHHGRVRDRRRSRDHGRRRRSRSRERGDRRHGHGRDRRDRRAVSPTRRGRSPGRTAHYDRIAPARGGSPRFGSRGQRRRSKSRSPSPPPRPRGRGPKRSRTRSPSPPPRSGGRGQKMRSKSRSPSPLTRLGRRHGPRMRSKSRSPSPRSGGRGPKMRSNRSPRSPSVSVDDRDARTVFVTQLSRQVRVEDVWKLLSTAGKIKDVALVTCKETGRLEGAARVEYKEARAVRPALDLSGQKLLGIPITVQQKPPGIPPAMQTSPISSDSNYTAVDMDVDVETGTGRERGPMRLYVGSLHSSVTEEMLRGIFEPFGRISQISQLLTGPKTGKYGFVTFADAQDAEKALDYMNGFELEGRPIKVGSVPEPSSVSAGPAGLHSDELKNTAGSDLGTTGLASCLTLLAQLPETGNRPPILPTTTTTTMPRHVAFQYQQQQQLAAMTPPVATQCFLLSNVFDPAEEEADHAGWDREIRDDVVEECNKWGGGGVVHLSVDRRSPNGLVFVKCESVEAAVSNVSALHGRCFAGRDIRAAYVPVANYNNLFPESKKSRRPWTVWRK